MDAVEFLKRMTECLNEFRKTQGDTADDIDLAHFFDPKLKKFLLDNKKLVNKLFELRSTLQFQKFVAGYIWKGK